MTAELIAKVEANDLSGFDARALRDQGADLEQGLAHALGARRPGAVLVLAHECGVRLEGGGEEAARSTADEELLAMTTRGEWAMVAYLLALDCDYLDQRLRAEDSGARRELRRSAGGVRVELPRDFRDAFAKTGSISQEINVEQPRWLLPRPRKDQCFMKVDGTKLDEGWYSIVHYPLGDDLKEAVLRRRPWQSSQREKAAKLLKAVGETLFCKAVKADQWELVEWLLAQGNAAELARQLEEEFGSLWDREECKITLQTQEDLSQICAFLGDDGILGKPWRRGKLTVPAGARVLSPKLEALREAEALGSLALEALRRIGGATVAFAVPQPQTSRRRWLADLADVSEGGYSWPLMHRAIHAGRLELMRRLLNAMASPDVCDARGRSALLVAATAGRWEAAAELLKEGCQAAGRNGMLALEAVRRGSREGPPAEVDKARELLDVIYERQQHAPAANLTEFFRRQAKGEVTHGIEPRRFELRGEELQLRVGGLRVWARALVFDSGAEQHDVLFIALAPEDYIPGGPQAEVFDLGGRRLLREEHLLRDSVLFAAPVAVPPSRLAPAGRDGALSVRSEVAGGGRLVGKLPAVARTPPCGSLYVTGTASCCGGSIGRIEVFVNGTRIGETPELGPGSEQTSELKVSLPLKEMDVSLELSGQKLKQERLLCSPGTELFTDVPVSIFVYVQPIEGEDLDFVFVCGHRRDVPLEDGARAFIGEARWDSGCVRLGTLEPLVLGPTGCLDRLRSLVLRPDLPPGRQYEMVEWEDTGDCQFLRCIVNPVRVGKIFGG